MPREVSQPAFSPWTLTDIDGSVYDWGLEIRKRAVEEHARPSPPFRVEELQQNVTFTGEVLAQGFPNLTLRDHFRQKNNIQEVYGKTSFQYTLGQRYSLDINLFHKWQPKQAGQKTVTTSTTAAVLLYSHDWDEDMRADVSVPRPWGDSFAKQFLQQGPTDQVPGGAAEEPLDHLLAWVEWIQKALDSALEKKGKATGEGA
jgi:hypothetical protein